jgi:hypothetical protein
LTLNEIQLTADQRDEQYVFQVAAARFQPSPPTGGAQAAFGSH